MGAELRGVGALAVLWEGGIPKDRQAVEIVVERTPSGLR